VADVDFISLSENNKLLISCHGDGDDVVPYSCGQPLGNAILPELCGGGAMLTHTESIGFTNHQHLLYPGQGHVPWEYGGEPQDEMIDFVSDNLYAALDCMNIGVDELAAETINIYPNPTKDQFTFDVNYDISVVEVYNLNGAKLLRLENTNSVNIQHLPKGVYMVELTTVNQQKSFARVVKM